MIDGLTITGNIFSGQTFQNPAPEGCGFATQFATGNNVPRQLVTLGNGGGSGTGNTQNVTFSNNTLTGTAGAAVNDAGDDCGGVGQGNTLVTIDATNATITNNDFTSCGYFPFWYGHPCPSFWSGNFQ